MSTRTLIAHAAMLVGLTLSAATALVLVLVAALVGSTGASAIGAMLVGSGVLVASLAVLVEVARAILATDVVAR